MIKEFYYTNSLWDHIMDDFTNAVYINREHDTSPQDLLNDILTTDLQALMDEPESCLHSVSSEITINIKDVGKFHVKIGAQIVEDKVPEVHRRRGELRLPRGDYDELPDVY
jgi:hypothetical protein